MNERKSLGRGLESVSHLFLSRREPSSRPALAAAPAPAPVTGHAASTPYLFVASGAAVISKAIVTCNVALELARQGHRTAVVDADPNLPTLRLLMGVALDSTVAPARLALDEAHEVRVFDTLEEVMAAGDVWDYVVVNAPAALMSQNEPPVDPVRLLLVVSPEARGLIWGYAMAKRAAHWPGQLELGVVVSGIEEPEPARAFFDQFLDVLERQASVEAAYCGHLPERDEIGRSVLRQVPAVMGGADSDLAERLRAIAEAVARVFGPAGRATHQ